MVLILHKYVIDSNVNKFSSLHRKKNTKENKIKNALKVQIEIILHVKV